VRGDQLSEAVRPERWSPAHQLEQDATEGVDVRAVVHVSRAAALLGRHVRRRTHHSPGLGLHRAGRLARELGDAEVEYFDPRAARGFSIQHEVDVVGLEVAMNDALLVGSSECTRDLPADHDGDGCVQRPLAQPICEALPVEKLHENEGAAGRVVAEIEDIHDPGMADHRRGARLVEEPLDDLGVARQLGVEELDDGLLAEQWMLGDVHHPHPTLAELATHQIASDGLADHPWPLIRNRHAGPCPMKQPSDVRTWPWLANITSAGWSDRVCESTGRTVQKVSNDLDCVGEPTIRSSGSRTWRWYRYAIRNVATIVGDNHLESTIDHAIDQATDRSDGLLVVAGKGRLSTHVLTGDEIVIGRAPECDVIVDDRALSRRHAILRRVPQLALQDLGSTNGTRLARGLLRGGQPVALELGESFHIGPFTFVVVGGSPEAGSSPRGQDPLVIEDPTVDHVSSLIHEIARSTVNVLIQGETGVGKEVLAASIHELSGRPGPFVRINCAALSEALLESELFGHHKGAFTGAIATRAGLLEAAADGTVFLDEIGELPLGIQAKLLRAVEAREVLRLGSTRPIPIAVRFVAATNRELPAEVASGRFRRDLYFRVDGVTLRIPPLRERVELIAPLALRFFAAARPGRTPVQPTPELLAALATYDWPGNVRELKAVIERAVLLAGRDELGVRHLTFVARMRERAAKAIASPAEALPAPPAIVEVAFLSVDQRADRDRILDALERTSGNQTRAAKLLDISRTTLINKLSLYRIPRPRTRRDS
jgi:DNA-binding NtrC family response regulator